VLIFIATLKRILLFYTAWKGELKKFKKNTRSPGQKDRKTEPIEPMLILGARYSHLIKGKKGKKETGKLEKTLGRGGIR
jgi:hypothetical protein